MQNAPGTLGTTMNNSIDINIFGLRIYIDIHLRMTTIYIFGFEFFWEYDGRKDHSFTTERSGVGELMVWLPYGRVVLHNFHKSGGTFSGY
ncbi:hypothetical protein [Falsirhodobacter xinxiangensis]|uniref:hypothetical protein n=1 Tax=Falsirhodobacter xinxiangensis TaxID=2530049 RepID=UPI0010A9AB01|nr:hypothetical protein [Rhodobacter xinxiangensis]